MAETYMPQKNWAGNYTYQAKKLHQPTHLEQVQQIVAQATRIHVLGSRHSFSNIADSLELISLTDIPTDIIIDREANTISFSAWMTYGDLVKVLNREGLALHNLAALPHISVAGAVSTATHGSGVNNGNLATAVVGLEMIRSNGELIQVTKGDADFNGMVVGLGALGVLTRLTLQVQPAYQVQQRVFLNLSWQALHNHFDEITSSAYSVSIITRWGKENGQVWVKRRMDEPELVGEDLFGAVAATKNLHLNIERDADASTPQLGLPGLWSDRLPHFRMDRSPSDGAEIQSEYFVAQKHAIDAIEALHAIGSKMQSILILSEIRRVAADQLWMSMNYEQDCIAFHFTWKRDMEAVRKVLVEVEQALTPFRARPHWGKVSNMTAADIAPHYIQHAAFVDLMERMDPRSAFHNDWLETSILSNA